MKQSTKIRKESKVREITLINDTKVRCGSDEHIKYLEDLLSRLYRERDRYKRGSSTRADYSKACWRTKGRLKRAERIREREVE